MQKIMMLVKLWCAKAAGFESGLRAWELDVGEWERATGTALTDAVKYAVMMNMAPTFLRNNVQLGTYATVPLFEQLCCIGVTLPETLEQIVPCQLEKEQARMMTTRCMSTLSRKARGRAKGKHQNQKGNRTNNTSNTSNPDINACMKCVRTGHWAKDCWIPGGGAYDNPTSNNSYTQKDKNHKKGKGKQVDVVETNQSSDTASTVSYRSQAPSTIGAVSCNPDVVQKGWITGVTINFVSSTRRQAGAEFFAS